MAARVAATAGALAAAAAVALAVRQPGHELAATPGSRVKGEAIAFSLVRDDGARIDGAEGAYRDGDQFKALVTCPPGAGLAFDPVVLDSDGVVSARTNPRDALRQRCSSSGCLPDHRFGGRDGVPRLERRRPGGPGDDRGSGTHEQPGSLQETREDARALSRLSLKFHRAGRPFEGRARGAGAGQAGHQMVVAERGRGSRSSFASLVLRLSLPLFDSASLLHSRLSALPVSPMEFRCFPLFLPRLSP